MELKSPAKKGYKTPHYRPPLPILNQSSSGLCIDEHYWPTFNGYYNGTSVIVDDPSGIITLTNKGFFGKGSLSKGCPNLTKRKMPNNVLYESQWKRRKHWMETLNKLLKSKNNTVNSPSPNIIENQIDLEKNSENMENIYDLTNDSPIKINNTQVNNSVEKSDELLTIIDSDDESDSVIMCTTDIELSSSNIENNLVEISSNDEEERMDSSTGQVPQSECPEEDKTQSSENLKVTEIGDVSSKVTQSECFAEDKIQISEIHKNTEQENVSSKVTQRECPEEDVSPKVTKNASSLGETETKTNENNETGNVGSKKSVSLIEDIIEISDNLKCTETKDFFSKVTETEYHRNERDDIEMKNIENAETKNVMPMATQNECPTEDIKSNENLKDTEIEDTSSKIAPREILIEVIKTIENLKDPETENVSFKLKPSECPIEDKEMKSTENVLSMVTQNEYPTEDIKSIEELKDTEIEDVSFKISQSDCCTEDIEMKNIENTGNEEVPSNSEVKIIERKDPSNDLTKSAKKSGSSLYSREKVMLKANEVLVISDIGSDLEQYFMNVNPKIEKEIIKTAIEVLYLSLEEAFFLSYACNCLQIVDLSSNQLQINDIWVLFQNSQGDFIEKYVAYHYFRAKGWVVKSGTKFGGDFLLYKKGPLYFHASYIVIVEVLKKGKPRRNNMTWQKIIGINRMAESATKEILICQVIWPATEKEKFKDPSILKEFTVCETLLRRWQHS